MSKILVLGSAGVGKTSAIQAFSGASMSNLLTNEVGADFVTVDLPSGKLAIWDTHGAECLKHLGEVFFRGVKACLFVYQDANLASFEALEAWRSQVTDKLALLGKQNAALAVLANKRASQAPPVVTDSQGQDWAQSIGALWFDSSVAAFESIAKRIDRVQALPQEARAAGVSSSAPAWVADEDATNCLACRKEFGWFLWRHHCRMCGRVFCASCSETRRSLPALGFDTPVRVCDLCVAAEKKNADVNAHQK